MSFYIKIGEENDRKQIKENRVFERWSLHEVVSGQRHSVQIGYSESVSEKLPKINLCFIQKNKDFLFQFFLTKCLDIAFTKEIGF